MKRSGPSSKPADARDERSQPQVTTEPAFFSDQISSAQRFFLDLRLSVSEPLVVVSGGLEHCAPDYHVHRESFEYCSMEFVARGEGRVRLGGKAYDLAPGVVFAYGPGVPHEISCSPVRPLTKYFVNFAGRESQHLLKSPAPELGQIVQSAAPDEILRVFDDLIRTGQRQTPFTSRICRTILEHISLKVAETAVPLGTIGSAAFETYQQCRQLIEENYLRMESLEEIARPCNVDPAYLCRLFARFDHQSPYRYLMQLRMREAARRLAIPGTTAKQVAGEMGFGDPFHFSRVFRRVIGVSPRQFMQMQRPAPVR